MQVDNMQSILVSVGEYQIAIYDGAYNVANTAIVHRGDGAKGLATWGMSGCHGVAVFGGQNNIVQVQWLAMYHCSGGINASRLQEFIDYLGNAIPQPGGNFEWVLVLSQGDESGQTYSWTQLGAAAQNSSLFNTNPIQVRIMNGPAPGGSRNAFAVDFDGHWGA